MRSARKLCTLGPLERNGRRFASTGSCGQQLEDGEEISGTIELSGNDAAERASAKVSVQLVLKNRAGAAERVRFGVETKWKRLGDCV